MIDRVSLATLRRDQYRQACEWEYGPQENADWEQYERDIEDPAWTHFAISLDGEFIGCVSLEQLASASVAFHLATARRSIHPQTMAGILLRIADHLFASGIEKCVATAPPGLRAVDRLAVRCGMTLRETTEEGRRYILTREERHNAVFAESAAA